MEMVLNNGFCEMSQDEMMLLEGGDVLKNVGYGGATVCCVMACVATTVWYWYDATR